MEPNMTLLVVQTVQAIYELTIQTSQKDNQKTKIIQVTFKTLTALGTLVITKYRCLLLFSQEEKTNYHNSILLAGLFR
jgi:hypothetical protein